MLFFECEVDSSIFCPIYGVLIDIQEGGIRVMQE